MLLKCCVGIQITLLSLVLCFLLRESVTTSTCYLTAYLLYAGSLRAFLAAGQLPTRSRAQPLVMGRAEVPKEGANLLFGILT